MATELNQQSIVTKRFSTSPDKYADEYGKVTSAGYSFRMRKDRLLELLGKGKGRVLDVGCGPAVMTEEMMQNGWNYEGTDISENMVTEAKKRAPKASFRVERVERVNTPDNYYARIVAMGLVEYLDDQKTALQEMYRVLEPEGRVFVSVPNWWSPARIWDRYIAAPLSALLRSITKKKYDGVFHREYSYKEYCAILEESGFSATRAVYYNFRIIPRPLDYWFPALAVLTARLLEPLRFTPLAFLGTGFIVVGEKK